MSLLQKSTWLVSLSRRFLAKNIRFASLTNSYTTTNSPVENSKNHTQENGPSYLDATDPETLEILSRDMIIHDNFLSAEEEKSLVDEIEPQIKRLRYEYEHWDDAIHGYRETERKKWNPANLSILNRVREISFPPGTPQIDFTHILDIKQDGYIKPHVDAVRFCGRTIAGLCLLSSCVMRLVNVEDKTKYGDILLNRRSLYIMKDRARYDYTHEVLEESKSVFKGSVVPRDRRISVICRNEPDKDSQET